MLSGCFIGYLFTGVQCDIAGPCLTSPCVHGNCSQSLVGDTYEHTCQCEAGKLLLLTVNILALLWVMPRHCSVIAFRCEKAQVKRNVVANYCHWQHGIRPFHLPVLHAQVYTLATNIIWYWGINGANLGLV